MPHIREESSLRLAMSKQSHREERHCPTLDQKFRKLLKKTLKCSRYPNLLRKYENGNLLIARADYAKHIFKALDL